MKASKKLIEINKFIFFKFFFKSDGVKYAAGCESSDLITFSQNITLTCSQNLSIVIIKADFGRDQYSMACDGKNYILMFTVNTR